MTSNLPRVLVIFIILAALNSYIAIIGGGIGCGGGNGSSVVTVTTKLLLPNGTEKELSDTPLARNLRINLTYSETVDSNLAESLFTFTTGGKNVANTISWNDTNTMMTVKPNNLLDYQKIYTIAFAAGSVSGSATIEAFGQTFKTMVQDDINGDGKADLYVFASEWEGGNETGRIYLFYGSGLADRSVNMGASSADAIITGESAGNRLRCWLTTDLNDDGYADLNCDSTNYNNNTGRSYFFYGGPGNAPITGSLGASDADIIYTGSVEGDYLTAISFNDVNGDGYTDILFSGWGCSSGGCLHAFFGPDFESGSTSGADVTITAENVGDHFAGAITGDVNGDGIADITANAQLYYNKRGRIYIFYGGSDLVSKGAAEADVIITGEDDTCCLNAENIGDLDGDDVNDVVAGAGIWFFENNREKVYIFYSTGLTSKNASEADVIFTGENAGDGFGGVVNIGDVTGDGTDDMITYGLGYNSNTGRIYGFTGDSGFSSKGAADADFIFTGEQEYNYLTAYNLGDLNGDGIDDIVADSVFYPDNNQQGRVYVFFGASSMKSKGAGEANVIITGEQNNDIFFSNQLLDVDGDAALDLFGGALGYSNQTGRGYLFFDVNKGSGRNN